MHRIYLISPLLLTLVVAPACQQEEEPDVHVTVDTAAFLQLESNHAWNYGTEIAQGWPGVDDLQVYLRSGDPEAGDTAIPFAFTAGVEDQVPDTIMTVWFDLDGAGDTVITALTDDAGDTATFDPPVLLGPSSWDAGESVTSSSTLDGSPVTFDVELTERGQYEVYYGLFDDVAVLTVDDGGVTPLGGRWYLAADVGPIALKTGDDGLPDVELVTYR